MNFQIIICSALILKAYLVALPTSNYSLVLSEDNRHMVFSSDSQFLIAGFGNQTFNMYSMTNGNYQFLSG